MEEWQSTALNILEGKMFNNCSSPISQVNPSPHPHRDYSALQKHTSCGSCLNISLCVSLGAVMAPIADLPFIMILAGKIPKYAVMVAPKAAVVDFDVGQFIVKSIPWYWKIWLRWLLFIPIINLSGKFHNLHQRMQYIGRIIFMGFQFYSLFCVQNDLPLLTNNDRPNISQICFPCIFRQKNS